MSSATMSGTRSLAFARVFAPDFATHLLVSHAAVFASARKLTQNSSPKGQGVGERGRSVVDQRKTTVFELRLLICVLAEQTTSYSGKRLTHPQSSPQYNLSLVVRGMS